MTEAVRLAREVRKKNPVAVERARAILQESPRMNAESEVLRYLQRVLADVGA
jgi:hypothetical protein